jgi:hypothetical protein
MVSVLVRLGAVCVRRDNGLCNGLRGAGDVLPLILVREPIFFNMLLEAMVVGFDVCLLVTSPSF